MFQANIAGGRGYRWRSARDIRKASRPRSSSQSLIFHNIARALFIVCSRVYSRLRCLAMHMDAHGLERRAFPCSIRAELTNSSSYDRMKDAAKNGEKQNFQTLGSWEFASPKNYSLKWRICDVEGRRLTTELVSGSKV